MTIYASDLESTGLLEQMAKQEFPRLHNLCSIDIETQEVILFEHTDRVGIQAWLDEGHTFIMHNCYTYDMPVLEFLGYDFSKTKFIDSLALSWALEPTRMQHGLAAYGEEFGVKKPAIEDWSTQTQEEYNHRVIEDCKIQRKLWLRQVSRLEELYGKEEGSYKRYVDYLMFKMSCLRQQQDNRMKIDVPAANLLRNVLENKINEKTALLIEVMPMVNVYSKKTRPSKPFKKTGELSATGEKWKALTEEHKVGFDFSGEIKVIVETKQGNPASPLQMKAWLDSYGWVPETFRFVKENNGEMRKIPQYNLKGGEICQSVKDLIPKCAGIEHIAGLGILNHRYSVVNGWLTIADENDGYITARAQGFTNTLRLQHKEYCNVPSTRVAYGKELRSLIICEDAETLMGSDLSSVEDRLKQSFIWKLDKAYVLTQMVDGYDPHTATAIMAGLMTIEEDFLYKEIKNKTREFLAFEISDWPRIDLIRAAGKSTNYACQYGAGVSTIARTAKVSERVAKKLHEGYWILNWAVKKVASMTTVKQTSFGVWQYNPVNKFWYSLRGEKDRFSTLIQGTGSYVFDIWVFHCLRISKQRGMPFKMIAQTHDDLVVALPKGEEEEYKSIFNDGMAALNKAVSLNRQLDCDIAIGLNGAEIH